MSVFRSFRNPLDEGTRAQLLAQVRANVAAMNDDDFAAFLDTLPDRQRGPVTALRAQSQH
jgi:hypothetical protein